MSIEKGVTRMKRSKVRKRPMTSGEIRRQFGGDAMEPWPKETLRGNLNAQDLQNITY